MSTASCRDVSKAKDFVTFVSVHFDKLVGAELDGRFAHRRDTGE